MMGMESPVCCLFRGDFLDAELFALRSYIRAVEKVPEDCLFDPTEAPACNRAFMQPIDGTEA